MKIFLIGIICTLLISCANVHQIDRYYLSKNIMKANSFDGSDKFREEFHSIREGSAGSISDGAGGGCGCS